MGKSKKQFMIKLKSEEEIDIMREGGSILSSIMREVKSKVSPGITTRELDAFAESLVLKKGGSPSFKGYKGFPAALCTSVNEVIVHGVPGDYVLKEGDIISLDLGVHYKGLHTDMAVTVPVGEISGESARVVRTAKKALKRGIKKVKEGSTLGDIGNTISRYIHKSGLSVVEGLCGHGIGEEVHEDPQVLNEGKRGKGEKIVKGMVFCIEPMVSAGSASIKKTKSGIETADGSLSAHFEHTIAVTEKGVEVITE